MGNQSRNGRLGAAVRAIKQTVVALACEVCGKPMGYCSDRCIRAQAERDVS